MAEKISTAYELAKLLAKNAPPAGWKIEAAFRPASEGAVEVAFSAPITYSSWVNWGDEWPLVKVWKFEPQNIPYYPEDYGDTPAEALEALCEEIAEEWWDEIREL